MPKTRFTILHNNPKKGLQYNSFHKETVEKAIEAFEEKGYDADNIEWIQHRKKEIYNKLSGFTC